VALLYLHVCTKSDIARWVCLLVLPKRRCARRSSRRVVAHFAENHGARCLSHLLGLDAVRRVVETSTTLASTAYSSRKLSTRSALSSLEMVWSSTMA
jgi:uncharacterized protein (UPF0262 family)